jgi:hypothetical protein
MSDLDLIYGTKPEPTPPPAEEAAAAAIPLRKRGGAREQKNKSSLERKNVRTNARTNERTLKHHSFDVFVDQLISLDHIRTRRYQETGKKPKIGTLVQEALDEYIRNQRKKEQKNKSSLERKNEP